MTSQSADEKCSVSRSLTILGERWILLILREALLGTTRFVEFQAHLGIGPDVLSERLAALVECGVLVKQTYRVAGQRARSEYHLTPAGRQLHMVVGALQQWGDRNLPRREGPTLIRRARRTDRPVRVAFVDDLGYEVPASEVDVIAVCR
jgi:DNA-binding HxlR family transcriptional regulator